MSKEAMNLALESVRQQPAQQEPDYTTTRNAWTGRATHKCNRCGREDFRSEHSAKFHKCQALAEQPAQQEPVAVKQIAEALRQVGLTLVRTSGSFRVMDLGRIKAQTTSPQPAQRTWVGLNEDQRQQVRDICDADIPAHVFHAIETKLKEKNT